MTQYAVTITTIVDSPELAATLLDHDHADLERLLAQPQVSSFATNVMELDDEDGGGMPTVEARVAALIEYLGNDRALHALESEIDRMGNV